jgi:hypothetical protein
MSEVQTLKPGGNSLPLDIAALESLPVAAGGVARFDFVFRHIRFSASLDPGDGVGSLRLSGDCGPLPFTAESPQARAGLGQIVVEANDVLGRTFGFGGNRIGFEAEIAVAPPLTATHVIAAAATVLVPAIPYLDLIAVYIRPPLAPAPPGESALRPEWRRRAAGKR